MVKIFVSIILPVYNVQPYLRQCIDSIINQTYKNWELIIVDDGSSDSCCRIADEYASVDDRITVIHQKNMGLSGARNTGLDIINGKYVVFVDSDDYLEKDYLRCFIKYTQDDTIVCCGHNRVFDDGTVDKCCFDSAAVLEKNDFLMLLLQGELDGCQGGKNKLGNYMWNKIYPSKCFNEVRFPIGRIFEDMYIAVELFKKVSRFVILPIATYNYRIRLGSIVNSNSKKRDYDMLNSRIKQENDLKFDPELCGLAKVLTVIQSSNIYSKYLRNTFELNDAERRFIRKIIKERM